MTASVYILSIPIQRNCRSACLDMGRAKQSLSLTSSNTGDIGTLGYDYADVIVSAFLFIVHRTFVF